MKSYKFQKQASYLVLTFTRHTVASVYTMLKICNFLAHVFISVLRHGFIPAAFRDATI